MTTHTLVLILFYEAQFFVGFGLAYFFGSVR